MPPLRILLVDDHALFRDGLISLLSYQDDFTVVGEAEDSESALVQARALEPDLVLMDIELPGEDGVVATRRLKMEMPAVTVVMLTVRDDSQTLFDAIKAGAQGYLIKNVRSRVAWLPGSWKRFEAKLSPLGSKKSSLPERWMSWSW
jgi:DNA-binding NarL/FixJ family response regulator